jgi:hypothetical protein
MADSVHLALERFCAAAANFIQTVDSMVAVDREPFLVLLSDSLSELYSAALHLPAVEPDTVGDDEESLAPEEWARLSLELANLLREKIGPLDTYWSVFDSTENESPGQGTIAGDVSEIYFDLKNDMRLGQKGISQADFLWELRSSFRSHWGKHLLRALVAIHDRHLE